MSFVTVYPPPPPTWNHLTDAQRTSLRRSTRKVAKVLGTGMSTTVGSSGDIGLSIHGCVQPVSFDQSEAKELAASSAVAKPTKHKNPLFRLFTSPSPPPSSREPPVLHFSTRPVTPPFTDATAAVTRLGEGASRRAKLARIHRLLGDEVPVEVVFPSASQSSSQRPQIPLSFPQESWDNHLSKNTVIRIPIPALTREEKRTLGLDKERLQPVQEEDEPTSSTGSQSSDDAWTFPGTCETGSGIIAERPEPSITQQSFTTPDLDEYSQWSMASYHSSGTPSPMSIPLCESPLAISFISVHEDDIDEFDTPVSTWFDGDGQSPTLSCALSFTSSRYSFHAERPSSDSGQTMDSGRPLCTPPLLLASSSSFVPLCGCDDDVEPFWELTDALFASSNESRWSASLSTVVF